MARLVLSFAVFCALFLSAFGARSLTQATAPAPGPNYAPAPTTTINGVQGYSCPSPGTTGYLFQPAPCKFGTYAGSMIYCDLSSSGFGVVGIRSASTGNCTSTNGCPTGAFCSQQTANNGTCTPVAPSACFAGALAPSPGPLAALPGADTPDAADGPSVTGQSLAGGPGPSGGSAIFNP